MGARRTMTVAGGAMGPRGASRSVYAYHHIRIPAREDLVTVAKGRKQLIILIC